MNWRRGSFRVWILLSGIWCAGAAGYAYLEYRNFEEPVVSGPIPEECKEAKDFIPLSCVYPLRSSRQDRISAWVYIGLGLGGPLVVLGLGAGVGWILSGFKSI
jgi:hypothetical protein